jgi:hypothetical protein
MTKASLKPDQRKIVDIIEASGFGVIGRLSIRNGLPSFQPAPHITQEVRLGRDPDRVINRSAGDTLEKEFVDLFIQMDKLREGLVDIEVRHSLPFRLVLERRHSEFG